MRVVAGTLRGRKLFPPLGVALRATSDKVKEALFNILSFQVEGSRFLDLYAGSGSIGIEAMSRGAARVVFVEKDKKNAALIRKNLSLFPPIGEGTLFEGTVLDFLKGNLESFDLVYIDPPYEDKAVVDRLKTMGCSDILRPQGMAVIEHFHKTEFPASFGEWLFLKRYRYGGTVLSFYVKK